MGQSADEWVGRMVAGRYTIVSLLGEGGCGRVYVAEQAMGGTKRKLALKMLLPEHASNPEIVSRFLRECEVASSVEHPNVVRIYDFGEAAKGVLFIAMELVPGRSLASILAREGVMPVERAMNILAQLCRGVAASHDRGIVHRDLKPDNLMIVSHPGEPDFVKVLDFGIAKAVTSKQPDLTRVGEILGSPPYMSPEQLLAEEVDARSDVYALGVIAYELLTGTLPFRGGDLMEWAAQHIAAEPLSFDATSNGKNVSQAVRGVILRALAKHRSERPQDPRSFYAELVAASAARPSMGVAPTVASPAPMPTPRGSTVFAAPLPVAPPSPRYAPPPAPLTPRHAPTVMASRIVAPQPPPRRKGRLGKWLFRTALLGAVIGGACFALDVEVDTAEVMHQVQFAVDLIHHSVHELTS